MKKLPFTVKIITFYNLIQVIAVLYTLTQYTASIWFFILSLFEIVLLIIVNYYLIKKNKIAWKVLLIWFIMLTFSFDIPLFAWELSFGLHLSEIINLKIASTSFEFGLDFISLAILIIHIKSKKKLFSSVEEQSCQILET